MPDETPNAQDLTIEQPTGKVVPEEIVLTGCCHRQDLLDRALLQLTDQHFRNSNRRLIFQIMRRYHEMAHGTLDLSTFQHLLSKSKWDATLRVSLEATFKLITERPAPVTGKFNWAVQDLRDDHARQLTGEIITDAMEILEVEGGWSHPVRTGNKILSGHEDARRYLEASLAEIDRQRTAAVAPEGDIRAERERLKKDYERRAKGELVTGVLTSVRAIDDTTSGFQNGELWLVGGYTGQGKTQLVSQTSWFSAYGQAQDGKTKGVNVVHFTSETHRDTVMRRVHARHSRLPQFGCPQGLDTFKIRKGLLTPEELKIYHDVLDDIAGNPQYGELYVAQMPMGATPAWIAGRVRQLAQGRKIALGVVDYAALLSPTNRTQTRREGFDEILNDCKAVALENDIPLVSPWAVNQEKFLAALKERAYRLGCFSETSVAEKTADGLIVLLRDEQNTTELQLQFLKTRDSELPPNHDLEIDFRCAYLGDRDAAGDFAMISTSSATYSV